MLIALNVLILFGLFILLIGEELKHRKLKERVEEQRMGLGAITHQLLTPLSTLRKYNVFLQNSDFGSLSLAQHEAVNKMEVALGDAIVLLDHLLSQSHIEQAVLAMRPMELNVKDSVHAAMNAVAPQAQERKHRFTLQSSGKGRVVADPLLLHGIFDEIFLNAIAYTPPGGRIAIAVGARGKNVAVTVKDTGIGIGPQEKRYVFEKFFRGEKARTMYPGNGLGLSFAQLFAKECGGSIRFHSAAGKGTTFTITLPKA